MAQTTGEAVRGLSKYMKAGPLGWSRRWDEYLIQAITGQIVMSDTGVILIENEADFAEVLVERMRTSSPKSFTVTSAAFKVWAPPQELRFGEITLEPRSMQAKVRSIHDLIDKGKVGERSRNEHIIFSSVGPMGID